MREDEDMRRSAKVDVCPARSPHSNSLCVLTDTAAAHFSGYVRNGLHSGDTVVWAATPEDHERWEIQ